MDTKENILITVCARSGSKGVRGKNIKSLCGKPLIAYSLEHALAWGRGKHCVVSTDSDEIAQIAKEHGAEQPFVRPQELATDDASKLDVIRHALVESEKHYGETFDLVVDLDVSAPLRHVEDIENCYQKFVENQPYSLYSVVPSHRNPYFNMVEENEDGFVRVCKEQAVKTLRRQEAPKVYDMNASIYFYQRGFLLDESTKGPHSDKSMIYVMDELSAFDIDNEIDFQFVEYLIREGVFKP